MRPVGLALLLFLTLFGSPAAQARESDERVRSVLFQDEQLFPLHGAVGSGIMIIFSADERIIGFDIADPEAVTIDSWMNAASLFMKVAALPKDPEVMVRTQSRTYYFSVNLVQPSVADTVVRFNYGTGNATREKAANQNSIQPQYRITGEKSLRPDTIRDDGVHTFILWPQDAALPAVFAINAFGDEEIVDGYMRDGVFTIDRVYPKLVFRIDRKSAKADRLPQ